jgi:filamentous hemagglutinin family protein
MYSKRQWHFLFTALPAAALLAAPATAQIVTDGSLGRGTVTLTGRNVDIAPALGEMHGGNLFHSFRTFSVNPGQSATFVGPDSVRNVISRVTGGEPSRIDGVLRSTVGQADFYFINPSGIAFGPNARVDVPGSLHVGTAHELRFADGSTFSADISAKGTLTTAPPEAFGSWIGRADRSRWTGAC